MHKDLDSSDIFDDDELTISSAWARDSSNAQSEPPFKIGLNFLREDENHTGLSVGLDSFNSDWKNDSKEFSQCMEENLTEFTQDQIYKINNVNQKLRLLVLYENVNPQLRKSALSEIVSTNKNKGLKKPLKDKEIEFITQILDKHGAMMEKALEPIKMTRLASIPESKRKFYIKKSDMEDVQRKKALKALTIQKVRQFGLKKGLSGVAGLSKKKFQDKCQTIEQIMTQSAKQIEEYRVVDKINRTMLNEHRETQKDLKTTVEKYYTEMERMHLESFKLINQELSYRDMVLNSRNIKKIDFRKKTRNISEDLNTILGIWNFFSMMPSLGYQDQQVDKSQLRLDASFSKGF